MQRPAQQYLTVLTVQYSVVLYSAAHRIVVILCREVHFSKKQYTGWTELLNLIMQRALLY